MFSFVLTDADALCLKPVYFPAMLAERIQGRTDTL